MSTTTVESQDHTMHADTQAVCQLLVEIRTLLDRLVSTERTGAVSSVTVKYSPATKDFPSKPAPELKQYAGSEPQVEEAILNYGRAVLLLEQAQIDGWRQTVERLEAAQRDATDKPRRLESMAGV